MSFPHTPEIEELLGAYALDAVEPDEAALVEAHLATCPRCRQEVATHREVAGKLGSLGQEAPPLVWDRIAAQLSPPPPHTATVLSLGDRPSRGGPSRASRRRLGSGLLGLVAAALVVVLGVGVIQLNHRVNRVSSQLRASQALTMASVGGALAAPGSEEVALQPLGGGPTLARVVIDTDGVGYLFGSRMPALASTRTYELWGIVDNIRVPFGLLGANPATVVRFVAKGHAMALAVTNERAGGVATSTQVPLALGEVTAH